MVRVSGRRQRGKWTFDFCIDPVYVSVVLSEKADPIIGLGVFDRLEEAP